MHEKEVIKKILKQFKITQTELSKRMGYASQAGVSRIIGKDRKSISTQIFAHVLSVLDCELVVRSKSDPSLEWIITAEEESK